MFGRILQSRGNSRLGAPLSLRDTVTLTCTYNNITSCGVRKTCSSNLPTVSIVETLYTSTAAVRGPGTTGLISASPGRVLGASGRVGGDGSRNHGDIRRETSDPIPKVGFELKPSDRSPFTGPRALKNDLATAGNRDFYCAHDALRGAREQQPRESRPSAKRVIVHLRLLDHAARTRVFF